MPMFQEKAWTPPAQNPPRGGRGWLQVLLTGIVLFVAATLIMFLTGNPNLYPTVILVGNFLVPIAFGAFLYDHQHLSALTPETIAKSFCLGGILGVLGASVLEALLIPRPASPDQALSLTSGFAVGLIEEGCKIAAVIFRESRPQHFRITGPVILAYLFVSVLHGLWDGLPSTIYLIVPPGFHIPLVTLVLSVIGITVFSLMFRRATVQAIPPPTPVNP